MLYRYASTPGGRLVRKALVYTKAEHAIDASKIDPEARNIILRLRENGCSGYIVGGAVRDLLLNKTPKDFDIVTDATPARIRRLFRNARVIGKRFRLVHILCGSQIFEVSTFRSTEDGSVGNTFGDMDEDVMRRDFTVNALYYDPVHEQVIDYVGGIKDIQKRRIMPVIPLESIFLDDPVRIIRAIKYAASSDFTLPFALKRAIRKHAHRLCEVSASRITEELSKIITGGHARAIADMAAFFRVYGYLQPQAASLMERDAGFRASYLARLEELDALPPEARPGERLTYLLKDFYLRLPEREKQPGDGEDGVNEAFARVWRHCRRFILPMNPQRVEFDWAVRALLKESGVTVKGSVRRRRGGRGRGQGRSYREQSAPETQP